MYKLRILVVFCLFSMPVQLLAAMSSQLEAAYHQRYDQYTNEISVLESNISTYETCIEENERLSLEIKVTESDYEHGFGSKKQNSDKRGELVKRRSDLLVKCLLTLESSRGKGTFFSMNEIAKDQEYSRKRVNGLIGNMQELKIKILETNGELPNWWVK